MISNIGSVCSGIEAASVAWLPSGITFEWFSEIAQFPSNVLKTKYSSIPNLGDMNDIPDLIINHKICAPDMICGGTPCQAFSLAGFQNGLNDERGNLTLKYVDIIESNDKVRLENGKNRTIVFWENVEGVLTDKTNAFGCLVSFLAGLDEAIVKTKWPTAGLLRGPKRNVGWRVIDAKYFGLPQQRKRLYLIAGGKDFNPENILFENGKLPTPTYPKRDLVFEKDGHKFEIFRAYTDCLYSAYGTKWNGNAAAYNGSLFVTQDDRIRRLSPLECERLMGFPDDYTLIDNCSKTARYQAVGNSWAVPVVRWLGNRIINYNFNENSIVDNKKKLIIEKFNDYEFYDFGKKFMQQKDIGINASDIPNKQLYGDMKNIVDIDAPESIYISPVGCYGILRRKTERNIKINKRLEEVLTVISSKMSKEDIEKRSKKQKRGKFSE